MNPGDNSTTNWLCNFRGGSHPLWASLWNQWVILRRSLSALLEGLEVALVHCYYSRLPGGFLIKKKSGSLSIYLGRFPRAWDWILSEGNDSKQGGLVSIEGLASLLWQTHLKDGFAWPWWHLGFHVSMWYLSWWVISDGFISMSGHTVLFLEAGSALWNIWTHLIPS